MVDLVEMELLGTAGCHLCEEAWMVLLPLMQRENFHVHMLDIAEQSDGDDLIQRYGVRIPVLRAEGQELDWPFDEARVMQWAQALR